MSVPSTDFDDLLMPREVAELLGVLPTTVARWARDGLLKAAIRTPGGHRRYRRADVVALRDADQVERSQMAEDAVRLYAQGWSIRRVATELGCSYGRMRRILLRQTALRNRGGNDERGRRPDVAGG